MCDEAIDDKETMLLLLLTLLLWYTVVGGRSRLHLVDLGSCSRSRDGAAQLSLTSLGAVVTSLLSGQRQLPHRSDAQLHVLD